MRVLHSYKVYRPDIDGGIVSAIALACSKKKADISNKLLFARGRLGFGRTYDFGLVKGRAVASLGTFLGMPIAPEFPVALTLALRRADVVALHLPFPLNDLGIVGIPDRVGLVVHWHSEIHGRRLLARALQPLFRRTLARADRIIVSNEAIVENSPLLAPHRTKCEIVPFGVDFEQWDQSSASEEQRARVAELRERHPRRIAALGRLVPYKGFDVLLRALALVDAHLTIIGTGTERRALEELATELDVADRVTFTGYLTNDAVKVQLWAAEVFAFPSITDAETFGLSQLEAMAVGLPVVNTRLNTAVPWVARDGVEAITVSPKDPLALASALSLLLDDKTLARELGAAGQARARNQFADNRYIDRVQAIYREVYEVARRRA